MVRSETDQVLHRLANYVECQLSDLLQLLLAESRSKDAQSICYSGFGLVNDLRELLASEGGAN